MQVMDRFKQQCVAYARRRGRPGPGEEKAAAIASVLGGENFAFLLEHHAEGDLAAVGVGAVTYADCGFQLLYAFGEPEKAGQMAEAIRGEAERLQKEGVRRRRDEAVRRTAVGPGWRWTGRLPTTV